MNSLKLCRLSDLWYKISTIQYHSTRITWVAIKPLRHYTRIVHAQYLIHISIVTSVAYYTQFFTISISEHRVLTSVQILCHSSENIKNIQMRTKVCHYLQFRQQSSQLIRAPNICQHQYEESLEYCAQWKQNNSSQL